MRLRPDGRTYKIITRRSIAILSKVPKSGGVIRKFVNRLHKKEIAELYLNRFKRNISVNRLSDYLRFYSYLGIVQIDDDELQFHPEFLVPGTDQQWLNALAEQARQKLSDIFEVGPEDFNDKLQQALGESYRKSTLPTIQNISNAIGHATNREREYFRWCLYLYLDGDGCQFCVRRSDIIVFN